MPSFEPPQALAGFWQSQNLPVQPVLAGVSGGPDSLALLHALARYREQQPGLRLEAAHLNHLIRGEAGGADAAFVEAVCQEYGLACHLGEFDVPGLARSAGLSLEDAARRARYAFLAELAVRRGINLLLVAHNADDQAETLLLRLLRGTGPQGLAGMAALAPLPAPDPRLREAFPAAFEEPARALRLGRPFLKVWRREIEAYCAAHSLHPRQDETNREETYLRNRVRHSLLPYLEENYQPGIKANLARLAELSRAEQAWLDEQVEAAFRQLARLEPGQKASFEREVFLKQPLALQRRLARRAIQALRPLQDIDAAHIEAALNLFEAPRPNRLHLPGGLVCFRDKYRLGFRAAGSAQSQAQAEDFCLELPVPGEVAGPGGRWTISAAPVAAGDLENPRQPDRYRAFLDYDKIGTALELRPRHPGERYRPLGAPGRRKVQDVMLEAAIPREERPAWPLVVRPAGGEEPEVIAWIPGAAIAHEFRVTPQTRQVIDLQFRVQS